jgi:multidrug efflux pump subunit AcrA (membrane-fusion protein)
LELEGRGTLEPVGRHDVFAAVEGVVEQVLVDHGDIVQPNQSVTLLRNTDVDVKLTDLQGELSSTSAALRRVNTTLLAGKVAGTERERLHGERSQWIAKQASLKEQITLYERKVAQLDVRTPVAGQVVTWDVRNTLIHRPVERGQMLLSVADVNGEWELEIHMPEDRTGHIVRAQAELGRNLPVSFILATEPGVTYRGTLEEVHQRAEVRGEEGNIVLLRVAIDKTKLGQLRRGATVVGRVDCGRRSVGYVWFHDLWEFVQSRVLFRL